MNFKMRMAAAGILIRILIRPSVKVVWLFLGAVIACQSPLASGTCNRGKAMQQSAANGAVNEMKSADAVYNNVKSAFQKSNQLCFEGIRSLNISGSIPPLPLPSAVGAIVSKLMTSVINSEITSVCSNITQSLSGAMTNTTAMNTVLPGGVGRLSSSDVSGIITGASSSTPLPTSTTTTSTATAVPAVVGSTSNPPSTPAATIPSTLSNLWK